MSRKHLLMVRCPVAALIMLLACSISNAQVLYGSLTGTVSDPSGAAVPGANVEALDVGTGVAQKTTTNNEGIYLFSNLQPGTYRITISSPAFSNTVLEGAS
ncbi:MAG: carboxypeptidase regulatory-like domain-containing protein, partial [Acidobacteriaceae bacterium]|nr:carboxypeptidase regulatory-like domain-containing protein [Acidobacteriaceae bacterium]